MGLRLLHLLGEHHILDLHESGGIPALVLLQLHLDGLDGLEVAGHHNTFWSRWCGGRL